MARHIYIKLSKNIKKNHLSMVAEQDLILAPEQDLTLAPEQVKDISHRLLIRDMRLESKRGM